jgi:PucR C-terminal helix-turn-helix domain
MKYRRAVVAGKAGTRARAEAVSAVLAALRADVNALALEVRDRVLGEVPAYAGIAGEELLEQLTDHVALILESAAPAHQRVSAHQRSQVELAGASRERQGLPIEDVLRGWRVGLEVVIDRANRLAIDDGMPAEVLAILGQQLLRQADIAMTAMAVGHRRAELERAGAEQDRRTELVRAVMLGSAAPGDVRAQLQAIGIDPEREYCAIRASLNDHTGAARVLRWLERCSPHGPRHGLAAVLENDVVGFTTPAPTMAIETPVGVGPPVALEDLPASHRLAARAATAAAAIGRDGPTRIESLGLLPAILADADVGAAMERRYLEPVRKTRSSAALLQTIAVYLARGPRVEAVAEHLFLHPNTVRYRLRRYSQLTGADLGDIPTLAEIHWALQRARLC